MSAESPPGNFTFDDGASGQGFSPAYRFEPYSTQFETPTQDLIRQNNPFVVLPNSLREPPPPNHKYVKYMEYIRLSPVRVWYFVENYSQLVDPTRSGVFGIRRSDGRMDYIKLGYKTQQREFNRILDYFRDPRGGSLGLAHVLSVSEAADSTRKHFIDFLKSKWNGGIRECCCSNSNRRVIWIVTNALSNSD